ncbi:MAG: hypothetical protein CMG47_00460 [Candidatus Marinimicrobia bacterium]|nr:hypothetical protein [Candidatus Neomarinimicrobiota bacterium]
MFTKFKNYLINKSINYPIRTIVISLLLTLFIFLGIQWFKLDDDLVKTFPQNLPSKIIWDSIQEDFGQTEFVFVSFGTPNNNILEDKIAVKQNALFTNAVLDNITGVDKVISLSNYNKFDGDEDYLDIGPLQSESFLEDFNDDDIINQNLNEIITYFENNPDQKQRLVSNNNDYLNIAIRPFDDSEFANIVTQVKSLADKYLGDYDIHFAGQPYLAGETPNLIKKDVSSLMAIGIIIMFIILFLNLRSFYAVFIILLTIISSFLVMLGSMGWMRLITGSNYFDFTMMNTSMPIILLTIANSDGVHIVSKFFKELRKTKDRDKAIFITMDCLMQPIFLTSITTSAAFMTMISSPLEYMVGYSVGLSFGVMWALFLSCTMLPSLISLKNWSLNSKAISKESILEKLTNYIANVVIHKPKKVLFGGLLIICISAIGIWLINVEVNVIKFYKKGNPIRESTIFVDDNFTGTMNLSIKVEDLITDSDGIPNYEHYLKLYNLQNFLEDNNQISMTFSFVDILGQAYKAYTNSDSDFIPNADALEGTYTMLSISDKSDIDDDLISLLGKDYDDDFYDLDQLLLTAMIKTISTAEIQNLISQTEEYIEQNFDNPESNVKISGLSVFIKDFVNIIVTSSMTSILFSLVLILFITGLFFNSFKWGFLSIIPLASAIILNFGLMGIFGIDLNHMTALLSSVIIGVGVDFSIHYISDYRKNIINNIDYQTMSLKTSQDVGYPILLDVFSNMGFIALLFSILIPLNHMGGLMVFAMISTSFGTLTILASLIKILKIKNL